MIPSRLARIGSIASLSSLILATACGGRDELDLEAPEGLSAGGSAGASGAPSFGGTNSAGSAGKIGTGGLPQAGGFGGSGGFGGGSPSGGSAGKGGTGPFGGSAGQGGFGGEPGEDCTNGTDDDGDGALDCQDPDCIAGFTCAPDVPAGWQGPIALWEGASAGAAPSCSKAGGYPELEVSAMADLTADPAQCADCSCNAPQGIVCPTARLGFYSSSSCDLAGSSTSITSDECHAFVFSGSSPTGLRWLESPALGGACRPALDGSSRIPPLEWDRFARACGDAPEGGGCMAGACVPRPVAPFESGLCIYRGGSVSCPAGPYAIREVYHQRAADSRSCTECECSSPAGASCTGSLTLATDRFCSAGVQVLSSAGQCAALTPDPTLPEPPFLASRSFFYEDTGPVGGSCSPSGGQSAGGATPADALTICCL